jgi:hypothetical protein
LMQIPIHSRTVPFEYFVMMGDLISLVLFLHGAAIKSTYVLPDSTILTATSMVNLNTKNMKKSAVEKQPSHRRLNSLGGGGGPSTATNSIMPNHTSNIISSSSSSSSLRHKKQVTNDKQVVHGSPSSEAAVIESPPTQPMMMTPVVRAREELAQLIADVHRMAVNWFHAVQYQDLGKKEENEVIHNIGIRLFGAVMRKIFFLDMLPDLQVRSFEYHSIVKERTNVLILHISKYNDTYIHLYICK